MCVKDYHRVLQTETRTTQPQLMPHPQNSISNSRHPQQSPTNQKTPSVTSSHPVGCPTPPLSSVVANSTDVFTTLPYKGTLAAADTMTFCYICELKVEPASTSSLVVMGRLFHSHCFTCFRCGRQPKMGQHVNIESKRVSDFDLTPRETSWIRTLRYMSRGFEKLSSLTIESMQGCKPKVEQHKNKPRTPQTDKLKPLAAEVSTSKN